jgi:hypothetical protein
MPVTQNDVDWMAARLLPDLYDINHRVKYDRNTKRLKALYRELTEDRMAESPIISRMKEKLVRASGVAQRAANAIEAEADALIAEEDAMKGNIVEAFAPHQYCPSLN